MIQTPLRFFILSLICFVGFGGCLPSPDESSPPGEEGQTVLIDCYSGGKLVHHDMTLWKYLRFGASVRITYKSLNSGATVYHAGDCYLTR